MYTMRRGTKIHIIQLFIFKFNETEIMKIIGNRLDHKQLRFIGVLN